MRYHQISIQCFMISCGTFLTDPACLLLHFYTKRSIDDDRRITKRSSGSYATFFGQIYGGAKAAGRTHKTSKNLPEKRRKNVNNCTSQLSFKIRWKKTRKIVVKLLLNFRSFALKTLSKYPIRSDAYWISQFQTLTNQQNDHKSSFQKSYISGSSIREELSFEVAEVL